MQTKQSIIQKVLYPVVVLSLGANAFFVNSNSTLENENRTLTDEIQELRVAGPEIKNPDPCNLCKNYSDTYRGLNDTLLLEMSANYDTTSTTYQGAINQGTNTITYNRRNSFHQVWNSSGIVKKSDSRCIWFSLDSLKRFIWEIETNVCKCSKKENLGIRLYFARYPKIQNIPRHRMLRKEYEMQQTIFMIPTYENEDINTDFDPSQCQDGKYISLADLRDKKINFKIPGFMAMPQQDPSTSSSANRTAQNHGTLCPSECRGLAY